VNKPGIALASAAVALAAASVYLLARVEPEHGRPVAHAPPREVVASPAPVPVAAHVADAAPAAEPNGAHVQPDEPPTQVDHATRQRRQASEYLARLDDPAQRQATRERALDEARRSTAGLDAKLGLTAEQYERLIELLADQDLEKRVSAARCIVNPACVEPAPDSALFSSRDQAIRDIVGDEGLRELRAFRSAEPERRVVGALQSRLENRAVLTPMQSDDLARALSDESRRQLREMYQRQQRGKAFGPPDGPTLVYADDSPTADLALQSGEASVQAIRDSAATMLTGEQLITFNRMYDELLISFRDFIRTRYTPRPADGDRTP
jgi:hypothetical protein